MLNNKLYKVDSKGKVRVYYIETILDQYRMITGVLNGKEVKSKWTMAKPKNIGKTNETSGEAQAIKEVAARYEKKEAQGYYKSEDEAKANPDGNFFKPMLAYEIEKVIDKYKVFPMIADPKLDGMRMTIGADLNPISRKGKPILTAIRITSELENFFISYPNVILDGELYNHEYKDDFNTLMSIARQSKPSKEDIKLSYEKLEFHIYDCFHLDNPKMSAIDRKEWLVTYLWNYTIKYPGTPSIEVIEYTVVNNQGELDTIKEQHLEEGYEGTITRGPDSVYENKKSHWLLKHKNFITEEFKIFDILHGKGNRSDIAGTIVIERVYFSKSDLKHQLIKHVGCGIRGTHEYAKELFDNRDEYIGKIATIRHFGVTADESLRFATCIDINRPD